MSSPAAARERRAKSPQGQGGLLREEIVAAANRLLAEPGEDEGVSLRAVAREVGIAAPSVYLHFASKDDLFRTVLEEHFAALRRAIEAAAAGEPDPAGKLLAGCLAYCRFAAEEPGPYRILFGGPRRSPEATAIGQVAGAAAFNTLVDGVAACMRAGVAAPGDPLRVATDVWAALHGIASLRGSLPTFPWPPLAEQVASVVGRLTGLADPDRGGPDGAHG